MSVCQKRGTRACIHDEAGALYLSLYYLLGAQQH
jgi:hypothetical protein